MRGEPGLGVFTGEQGPWPLTGGCVERVVDVIGHPRSEAPVVGAVLKSGGRGGPREGRTQVRASGVAAEGPGPDGQLGPTLKMFQGHGAVGEGCGTQTASQQPLDVVE